ncbi:RNA polymerase sigma factor [Streptomyces anthocyanicus]|uniref:RNA polymerase sigma factor n=1 Tax=Streptomyces anthocyanicus TaxID=68174 RepID=UPI0037ABEFED|nr:sigma-70 family RNA polymerase sigma factor [Streptomyces anthocyanicus]
MTEQPVGPVGTDRREPGRSADSFRSAPTPEAAFDALYLHTAPHLVHQTHLLTGRRGRAFEAVDHAFCRAWDCWPEVAVHADPVSWVRGCAYEYALSPWHRFRETVTRDALAPNGPMGTAILRLRPLHRRTLVMCDGLGLTIDEAAAELEASPAATRMRLLHAHAALQEQFPDCEDVSRLREQVRALVDDAASATVPTAGAVRAESERRTRLLTRTAVGAVALLSGLVAASMLSHAPQHETSGPHPRVHGHSHVPAAPHGTSRARGGSSPAEPASTSTAGT